MIFCVLNEAHFAILLHLQLNGDFGYGLRNTRVDVADIRSSAEEMQKINFSYPQTTLGSENPELPTNTL